MIRAGSLMVNLLAVIGGFAVFVAIIGIAVTVEQYFKSKDKP